MLLANQTEKLLKTILIDVQQSKNRVGVHHFPENETITEKITYMI